MNTTEVIEQLFEGRTLAQRKELSRDLKIPFIWPSVREQISEKGEFVLSIKGRAKTGREMFKIPGVELENGLSVPGFFCHPSMAVEAANELLRLAEKYGCKK